MKKGIAFILLICAGLLAGCHAPASLGVCENGLIKATPESQGVSSEKLMFADTAINAAIARGDIPGAVLAVVRNGRLIYLKAYGNRQVYPDTVAMETDAVFDLASVSKCVGTAIGIMQLVERGQLRLMDRVSQYIPEFENWEDPQTGKRVSIRIVDLMTHSSGLPPYAPAEVLVGKYGSPAPDSLMAYISRVPRDFEPTTRYQYSCLNFITLQNVLQRITGQKLSDYAQKNIFDVLGMKHTMYLPSGETLERCCPTEIQPDGSVLTGKVHDPLARLLNGGNSGNAGVFSCAEDLALLAAALLDGGRYGDRRILSPLTVACMTRVPAEVSHLGRSLGWDNYSPGSSSNGNLFHPTRVFGHTGYTGTTMAMDPDTRTGVILLTNRVHPRDGGSAVRVRTLVANVVAASIIEP